MSGSHTFDIGPASCVAAVHVEPPFDDEMKPTSSWHVATVQDALG